MRRWWAGLILGVLVGWAAEGAAQLEQPLEEVPIEVAQGAVLSLPPGYGRLVGVAVISEVHHLYFEDAQGTIRLVRVGQKGAVQRARQGLQLLSRDVFVIGRDERSQQDGGGS